MGCFLNQISGSISTPFCATVFHRMLIHKSSRSLPHGVVQKWVFPALGIGLKIHTFLNDLPESFTWLNVGAATGNGYLFHYHEKEGC